MRIRLPLALSAAVICCLSLGRTARAQEDEPTLVVPVPLPAAVRVTVDSFRTPDGKWRAYSVTKGVRANGKTPIVIFANSAGTFPRSARTYKEWARLVTTRGFAGVLYDAPELDFSQSPDARTRLGVETLDSLARTLGRRAATLRLETRQVIIWAGSSQTTVGTPFSLEGDRPVAGYVLYYGSGSAREPRADVPVFMVRSGQDSPSLNTAMDTLAVQLTRVGAPLIIVHHPAGAHAFDMVDSTRTSAEVIAQTLDFMTRAIDPAYHAAVVADASLGRAAAAYATGQWSVAARLYQEMAARRPGDRIVTWRLGLAQLQNAQPAEALASFDRARTLGQGGARDIGLPATRAALRAHQGGRAIEWLNWALESYPPIRAEVERDAELSSLLLDPAVRRPS